jgi:hypothetical protein
MLTEDTTTSNTLYDNFIYEDNFATNTYLSLAEAIYDDGNMQWAPGEIDLYGDTHSTTGTVIWRCVSPRPISHIQITTTNLANWISNASHNTLAISFDGIHYMFEDTTLDKPSSITEDHLFTLKLDISGFMMPYPLTEFWVRAQMKSNGTYSKPTIANRIRSLNIKVEDCTFYLPSYRAVSTMQEQSCSQKIETVPRKSGTGHVGNLP